MNHVSNPSDLVSLHEVSLPITFCCRNCIFISCPGRIGGVDTWHWLPLLSYGTITFRHHWIPLLNFQHKNASWHLKRCSRHLPPQQKIPDEIPVRDAVRKITGAGNEKSNVHACASEGFVLRNNMPFIPPFISHFLMVACIIRCSRPNSKHAGIPSFCAAILSLLRFPTRSSSACHVEGDLAGWDTLGYLGERAEGRLLRWAHLPKMSHRRRSVVSYWLWKTHSKVNFKSCQT